MAITKDKKRTISAKLSDVFAKATSVVFVRFNKLSVADTATMRKSLKGEGVGYYVAKKSLIRRALTEKGVQGEVPELPGEIALAWSEDEPTISARSVYTSSKKYKDAVTIVGGVFEGAFADAAKMLSIATIPPLPVLRGMLVNVLSAPRQGLVIALDQIAKQKTN